MRRAPLLALVPLLALAACRPPATRVEVQRVEVPVAVPCPPPPQFQRPHLPIADVQPGAARVDVERAWAASVRLLQGYAEEMERALDAYRQTPKEKVP